METELYYQTNPLAVFTEADSQSSKDLIYKMAEEHYDFLLNTSVENVNEITQMLEGFDVEVYSSSADLSAFRGVEEFYKEILSLGRPIDALIVSPSFFSSLEISKNSKLAEQFDLIRSNTMAPVHLVTRILNEMQQRNAGKIIFSIMPLNYQHPSHQKIIDASLAFLKSYGDALKQELKDSGIEIQVQSQEDILNVKVKKKIQELASRYLPDWAKTESSTH